MHAAYFRLGGVQNDLSFHMMGDIFKFCKFFRYRLTEIDELLTYNKIWKSRLINVGVVSSSAAINAGFSGVLLRATGVNWDLRKNLSYEIYDQISFSVPLAQTGDCYARYLLRMAEMRQSIDIIQQALNLMEEGEIINDHSLISPGDKFSIGDSMETLINFFKHYSENTVFDQDQSYTCV